MSRRPEVLLETFLLTNGHAIRAVGLNESGLRFRTGAILGVNFARGCVLDTRNRAYSVKWGSDTHWMPEDLSIPDDVGIWHRMSQSEIELFETSRSAVLVTAQSKTPITDWVALWVEGFTYLVGLCPWESRNGWFTSRVSYIDPSLKLAVTYPEGCLRILKRPAISNRTSRSFKAVLSSWLLDPLTTSHLIELADLQEMYSERQVWPPEYLTDPEWTGEEI